MRILNWKSPCHIKEYRRWKRGATGTFSAARLGNTRAVVRYLARYTSRIAMSNQRIKRIDEEQRTVSFDWKDYKDGGQTKEMTMAGATFLRAFIRHMVPKGFRRIRYYGLLAGAPQAAIWEKAAQRPRPACPRCGCCEWLYLRFFHVPGGISQAFVTPTPEEGNRFSLCRLDTG